MNYERDMKRAALGLVLLAATGGPALAAIRLEIGVLGGTRTVNSAAIKAVYGNGTAFYPYLAVHPWGGLFVGAGYEAGYSRKGTIGIYEEPTTLRVVGAEAFVGYQIVAKERLSLHQGRLRPLFLPPDHRLAAHRGHDGRGEQWGPTFGGGLKISLSGAAFLGGEIRFVPLKVKPFEDEVELGGNVYGGSWTEILDITY